MSSTPKLYYSINEVCEATGLGRTSIYKEINSGRLKAVKANGRTLVAASAIEEWSAQFPPLRGGVQR